MALRRQSAAVAMLAAPLSGLLVLGSAGAAVAAPDQVSGVVVSGLLYEHQAKIGVPTAPVTFSSDGRGDLPVKYEYWINGGKHKTIKADKTGSAIVYLTFTTHLNGMYVEGIGADGTAGLATFNYYFADGATPAAEKDSDGDGVPDIVTVGDPSGLGSGLWLAAGRPAGYATGRVRTPAVNITGKTAGGDPSYFDGAKIITGNFLDDNLQDVMIYFVDGPKAGAGMILPGSGDGSPLTDIDGIDAGLDYFSDWDGNSPIDLANAYKSSGFTNATPDFIGISGNPSNGYHLAYYPIQINFPLPTSSEMTPNLTPTGGTDWENWQLFSTQVRSGTAIYLWNRTTGALYLWEGVRFTDNGDGTGSITYQQYEIAQSWNTGATYSTVEAVDFTGDGTPDLWTVTPAGVATAYVVSNLSLTAPAKISAKAPQNLG
ncbi:hypothetical protein [Rugosimonospora africana]|uniref:FG-GAP repeat protein n=1 Tax=Rugosimonospora africana TaxID=556532 RepID=A0A8J3VUR1_9ACTN|nr:hypothetical protein [Rugosimonospora africana]GIH19001.1 hypothetical protein Raf01_71730 [Rugosimonospora africana]